MAKAGWIHSFLEIGTDGLSREEKSATVICNVTCLTMMAVSLSYIPIFLYFNMPLLAGLGALLFFPYMFPLVLNKYSMHLSARIWIKLVLDMAIFLFAWASGRESGIHYGFFLSFTFPFLMINSLRLACILAIPAPLLFIIYSMLSPAPIYDFAGLLLPLKVLVITTVFLIIGIILFNLGRNYKVSQEALFEAAKFKEGLINMLCHDINNLLGSSIGHLTIIKKQAGADDSESARLDKALFALGEISTVINNIKILQAIETGKYIVSESSFTPSEVFKSLAESFEVAAQKKEVTLEFSSNGHEHTQLILDRTALSHSILGNLISNSIKFSSRGDTINISFHSSGEEFYFIVADNGTGIPQEAQKSIFNSTGQTSSLGTSGEAGTGFGLPIVKMLCDLLQGRVELESFTSKDGHDKTGTKFYIYFPRKLLRQ